MKLVFTLCVHKLNNGGVKVCLNKKPRANDPKHLLIGPYI